MICSGCIMVSIIVPVYNCKEYVVRLVENVFCQTFQDWELILVDDGSTDGSGHVCDMHADKDSHVCVIHQENKGASVARRVGIENARGEYLIFIDCDDIVEDDYVERLYRCLTEREKVHLQIAACDMVKHHEGECPVIDKRAVSRVMEADELQSRFFNYDFWGFGGKIYHRSVFENVYFPEHTINEDYVVMAQLFHNCRRMVYLPISLYHYMDHGESLSHQKLSKRMFDEYYNKLWVRDYYAQNNCRYLRHAEAQLIETCVKLLHCVKKDDLTGMYRREQGMLSDYLRNNIILVLTNRYIKTGVKLFAMSLLYNYFKLTKSVK